MESSGHIEELNITNTEIFLNWKPIWYGKLFGSHAFVLANWETDEMVHV